MRRAFGISIFTFSAVVIGAQVARSGIEASMSYKGPEGKVELVGVCRVTESDVNCWGQNRKPSPNTVTTVKQAFGRNDYTNVPVRYGKKTRLAIFKFTQPPYNRRTEGTIQESFSGNSSFDLPANSSSNGDEPRVTYRAAVITTDPDQKTGSVSTTISRYSPQSAPMAVKEGETLSYLGSTIKIVKIVKSQLDPAVYGVPGAGRWLVYYSTDPPLAGSQIGWSSLNSDGLPILAVDDEGNPIYIDPSILNAISNGQQWGQFGREQTTPKPKVYQAVFGASYGYGSSPGIIATNINPEKIKFVTLNSSSSQSLKIKDIPMDPLK